MNEESFYIKGIGRIGYDSRKFPFHDYCCECDHDFQADDIDDFEIDPDGGRCWICGHCGTKNHVSQFH